MNHQAKLIVFDWDGTLMDSESHIVSSLQAAIKELDLEQRSNDELRNIIGLGLREALKTLYPEGTDSEYDALTSHYREHFFDTNKNTSELFAGVEDLLEKLSNENYFMAIATGKGRHGLDKVLAETGLGHHFHFTRCADESFSKPHPQMLLEIMDYVGVEQNETLMIGDTEYDLNMAHNAGAPCLAVSYGVHDKSRLLACNPLECVDSINELQNWLLNG